MEEQKKQYLKVKAEIVYKSKKSRRLVKVKLMNIPDIEEQRAILQAYVMRKNPNLILSYKASKAEKLRRMHRQRSTQ